MITNWSDAFLWPKFKFSGSSINYLEAAKAADHLILHQHSFTMWYLQDKVSGRVHSRLSLFLKSSFVECPIYTMKSENGGPLQQEWSRLSQDLPITAFAPPNVFYELSPPALKHPSTNEGQQTKRRSVHLHMNHFDHTPDILPPHTTVPLGMQRKGGTGEEKALAIEGGKKVT